MNPDSSSTPLCAPNGENLSCASLDTGKESAAAARALVEAALLSLNARPGLLQKFRNPEQLNVRIEGWQSFDPVKGPAAYRRVWVRKAYTDSLPDAIAFHRRFHASYKEIVSQALAGERVALASGESMARELERHMAWEEARVYPRLTALLGEDRVVRELGYEHQGLRAALGRWSAFLEGCLSGAATRKQVEGFELDLLHLFEHHVEREENDVFPLLSP